MERYHSLEFIALLPTKTPKTKSFHYFQGKNKVNVILLSVQPC